MNLTLPERQMIANALTHFVGDCSYSWSDVPETMTPKQARYALSALREAGPSVGAMEKAAPRLRETRRMYGALRAKLETLL